ncbi:Uncharacterised protein [Mycobacteroides abscessus subsp. abscessus]|nr:Uncharacterised protein [Mycobacteroides abscessus subsp. abscessus]
MRQAGSLAATSRSTCSIITLVQPYGLVADVGESSVIGSTGSAPYTVADDENTNRCTSWRRIARSSENVLPRLFS